MIRIDLKGLYDILQCLNEDSCVVMDRPHHEETSIAYWLDKDENGETVLAFAETGTVKTNSFQTTDIMRHKMELDWSAITIMANWYLFDIEMSVRVYPKSVVFASKSSTSRCLGVAEKKKAEADEAAKDIDVKDTLP